MTGNEASLPAQCNPLPPLQSSLPVWQYWIEESVTDEGTSQGEVESIFQVSTEVSLVCMLHVGRKETTLPWNSEI